MRNAAVAAPVSIGHRRRAAFLGAALALALLVAATLTAASAVATFSRLTSQPHLAVDDAAPLLALLVLAVALSWLSIIFVVSSCGLLRRQQPRAARRSMPLAARIAAVLLAVTAFGSVSATSTATAQPPVAATATVERGDSSAEPPAPVPDFAPEAPAPDPAQDRPRAHCDLPEPGWTSAGPRLQRSTSTDQAGLLGRCGAGRPDSEVVVLRGDSLWSIAERELGPDASPTQVAASWPAWYAANRARIGPDPDVLLPGTVLHRPTQEVLR